MNPVEGSSLEARIQANVHTKGTVGRSMKGRETLSASVNKEKREKKKKMKKKKRKKKMKKKTGGRSGTGREREK